MMPVILAPLGESLRIGGMTQTRHRLGERSDLACRRAGVIQLGDQAA
jgi:hypothetical protein